MIIFNFIKDVFYSIWDCLFSTMTPFGVSFGVILFGCTIVALLFDFVITYGLGIFRSDISSLGSSKDYKKSQSTNRDLKNRRYQLEYDTRNRIINDKKLFKQ